MTSEATQPHDETELQHDDAATQPSLAADEPGEALRLQPRLVPRADGLYYVAEILGYHDESFVEAAFAAVLRRPPSNEELRRTLSDLRNGAREKIDILRDLARSEEGRGKLAFDRIAGLRQSPLAEALRRLPLVGHLWQVLAAVIRLPVALRNQRQFEAYALAQQQHIADHVNLQRQRISDELNALRRLIADQHTAQERLADDLKALRRLITDQLTAQEFRVAERLDAERRHHDEARERLAAELGQAIADASAAISLLSDALAEVSARQTEQQTLHTRRLDAQQEFLAREQQAIVEAQKAALADAEEGLRETVSVQRRELDALAARVGELRAAVEAARESVGGKV